MQCGDQNFENLRGKNIIAKIWYVDGFDGSNTSSIVTRGALIWQCVMTLELLNIHSAPYKVSTKILNVRIP